MSEPSYIPNESEFVDEEQFDLLPVSPKEISESVNEENEKSSCQINPI